MLNTIILTVHNKEKTISRILAGLIKNTSEETSKLIIILDGCTDKTEKRIKNFFVNNKTFLTLEIIYTDDIWETKANNIGLKNVQTEFATIVQDDMLILQKNWDKKLLNNFYKHKIFAISGRAAHNFSLHNNNFQIVDLVGREYPFSCRNIFGKFVGKLMAILKPYWLYKYLNLFAIRLAVNRGPLMFEMSKLKQLNFFDEEFAPFELDDIDLCCRAFKKFGLYSAVNPIFYIELNGSKKNSSFSENMSQNSIIKNTKIILNRHNDLSC
mgnify:CR=1 FL=1